MMNTHKTKSFTTYLEDGYYVATNDNRCAHDIMHNVYPCQANEGELVSFNIDED